MYVNLYVQYKHQKNFAELPPPLTAPLEPPMHPWLHIPYMHVCIHVNNNWTIYNKCNLTSPSHSVIFIAIAHRGAKKRRKEKKERKKKKRKEKERYVIILIVSR